MEAHILMISRDVGGLFVHLLGHVFRPKGSSKLAEPFVAHVTPLSDKPQVVRVLVPGHKPEEWALSATRDSRGSA